MSAPEPRREREPFPIPEVDRGTEPRSPPEPTRSDDLPGDMPDRARFLEAVARGEPLDAWLPWYADLARINQERLREDLALVCAEPFTTSEPLDETELRDILHEYAGLAGLEDPEPELPTEFESAAFRIDLRSRDARSLRHAAPAVRRAAEEVLRGFLAVRPKDVARLRSGRHKKLADRDLHQIALPDGYRLRYRVDEARRVVYVLYLGPHEDRQSRGRERAARPHLPGE